MSTKAIIELAHEVAEAAFGQASKEHQDTIANWYSPLEGDLDAFREVAGYHDDDDLDLFCKEITRKLEQLRDEKWRREIAIEDRANFAMAVYRASKNN